MHRVNPFAHITSLLVIFAFVIPACSQLLSRGKASGLASPQGGVHGGQHSAGPSGIGPSTGPGTGPSLGGGLSWDGPRIKDLDFGTGFSPFPDPFTGFRKWDALPGPASGHSAAASPNIAVGSQRMVIVTNDGFAVHAKYWKDHSTYYDYTNAGTGESYVRFADFFGEAGAYKNAIALHDHERGRFLIAALSPSLTKWYVAVSTGDRPEDPTGESTLSDGKRTYTSWAQFEIDAQEGGLHVANGSIGWDSRGTPDQEALYISFDVIQAGGSLHPKLLIFRKTDFFVSAGWGTVAAVNTLADELKDPSHQYVPTIRVCRCYSKPVSMWLASTSADPNTDLSYLWLWSISNPLDKSTPSKLAVTQYKVVTAPVPSPNQALTTPDLIPQDNAVVDAVYFGGNVYVAQSVPWDWSGVGTEVDRTLRLFKVATSAPGAPAWYEWWGDPGDNFFCPTIDVNSNEDVTVVFAGIGVDCLDVNSVIPSVNVLYTWRKKGDLYSHGIKSLYAGQGKDTSLTDSWGPCFGSSLDGGDRTTFWLFGEYGKGTSSGWGTYVRELNLDKSVDITPAVFGANDFSKLDFTTPTPDVPIGVQDGVSSTQIVSGLFVPKLSASYSIDGGKTWNEISSDKLKLTKADGTDAGDSFTGLATATAKAVPFNHDSLTENRIFFRIEDMYTNAASTPVDPDTSYGVRIDATPPAVDTAILDQQNVTQTRDVRVSVVDVTSGLRVDAAPDHDPSYQPEFWYHRASDPEGTWYGPLLASCMTSGGDKSKNGDHTATIIASAVPFLTDAAPDPNHLEKPQNKIKFHIDDMFWNDGRSAELTVPIDHEPPTGWANSVPTVWVTNQTPNCSIEALDVTTGLKAGSATYQYSTNGPDGPWNDMPGNAVVDCRGADPGVLGSISAQSVPFNNDSDTSNLIRWRVMDKFGNLAKSEEDPDLPACVVKIDSTPPEGWKNFAIKPSTMYEQVQTSTVQVKDVLSGLRAGSAKFWYSTSGPGGPWIAGTASCDGSDASREFQTVTATTGQLVEGNQNCFRFAIDDIAGSNGDSHSVYVVQGIICDLTGPAFGDIIQYDASKLTPDITVNVQDVLSGLKVDSAIYQYSTDGRRTWHVGPTGCNCSSATDGDTTLQTVTAPAVPFGANSADQYCIRFTMLDVAGNTGHSAEFVVPIDDSPPGGWTNFRPKDTANTLTPTCSVTVQSAIAGILPATAQYRVSTDGGISWVRQWVNDGWRSATCNAPIPTNPATIKQVVTDFVLDATGKNVIQFRIESKYDVMGESPKYTVKIDHVITDSGGATRVGGTLGDKADVSGNLTLQGFTGDRAFIVLTPTIEFRKPGTKTVVFSVSGTLDIAGNYTVTGVPAGVYDVACKFANWLRKVRHNVVIAAPATGGVDLSLINGDANGDNKVDNDDLNVVRDPHNWQKTGDPGIPGDLNWDGAVNILDKKMVNDNMNKKGDD